MPNASHRRHCYCCDKQRDDDKQPNTLSVGVGTSSSSNTRENVQLYHLSNRPEAAWLDNGTNASSTSDPIEARGPVGNNMHAQHNMVEAIPKWEEAVRRDNVKCPENDHASSWVPPVPTPVSRPLPPPAAAPQKPPPGKEHHRNDISPSHSCAKPTVVPKSVADSQRLRTYFNASVITKESINKLARTRDSIPEQDMEDSKKRRMQDKKGRKRPLEQAPDRNYHAIFAKSNRLAKRFPSMSGLDPTPDSTSTNTIG